MDDEDELNESSADLIKGALPYHYDEPPESVSELGEQTPPIYPAPEAQIEEESVDDVDLRRWNVVGIICVSMLLAWNVMALISLNFAFPRFKRWFERATFFIDVLTEHYSAYDDDSFRLNLRQTIPAVWILLCSLLLGTSPSPITRWLFVVGTGVHTAAHAYGLLSFGHRVSIARNFAAMMHTAVYVIVAVGLLPLSMAPSYSCLPRYVAE